MKKLLALAAAGVIALAATAMTATPSSAFPGPGNSQQWKRLQGPNNFKNPGNFQGPKKFGNFHGPGDFKPNKKFGNNWKPPHHGNYPKPPKFNKYTKFPKHYPHHNNFVGPFVFGLALGAIVNNAYAYDYAGLSPHQIWCLKNYPNTYNPATNLFYIKPGVVAVCVSPYSAGPVGYIPY